MFRHRLTIFASIALSPLLVSSGQQSAFAAPITSNSIPESVRWAWVKAPWTASDKPFIAIRQRIDTDISKGKSPYEQAALYKARALKRPNNAQSQFARGYSAWQAYRNDNKDKIKRQSVLIGTPEALERLPETNSAEFARMRFLLLGIVQGGAPADRRLREAGDRLLRRYPSDAVVQAYQARVIAYTSQMTLEDRLEAVKLASQAANAQPQQQKVHATLGGIYFVSWMKSHSRSDAQNAIAAYRKYLMLAPIGDVFRPRAESIIKQLQASL